MGADDNPSDETEGPDDEPVDNADDLESEAIDDDEPDHDDDTEDDDTEDDEPDTEDDDTEDEDEDEDDDEDEDEEEETDTEDDDETEEVAIVTIDDEADDTEEMAITATDDGRRRWLPALLGLGVLIIAGLVVGILALTGVFDDSDTASCSFGFDSGATFEGPARNETGGFDGQAAIDMTAVDDATCTVTFDIVWSDGLSGRGDAVTGVVDEGGVGVATGVFIWDDGDYALRIETAEVSVDTVRGTYEITAVEGGPTLAAGTGRFNTSRTDGAAG